MVAKWLAVIAGVLAAWLVYELANDPYEFKKEKLLASIENVHSESSGQDEETARKVDYGQILKKMKSENRLWRPLVKKKPRPKPRPKKPNLKQMIAGLKVLTVISAEGQVQVIVRDSRRRTQDVYKKGDRLRQLRVDRFTSNGVILSYKGYTIKLPF